MKKQVERMDLMTGCVPDYRTFVRHVWTYEEPGAGGCIAEPPWVYACVFEDHDEAMLACAMVTSMLNAEKIDHGRVEARQLHDDDGVWEIRFGDLEALHLFLVHVAAASQYDAGGHQMGEFLMWTLGFRWV